MLDHEEMSGTLDIGNSYKWKNWKRVDRVYQLIAQKQMLPNVAKFYTMVQCCFVPKKYQGHFNLGPKKQNYSHMEHFKT